MKKIIVEEIEDGSEEVEEEVEETIITKKKTTKKKKGSKTYVRLKNFPYECCIETTSVVQGNWEQNVTWELIFSWLKWIRRAKKLWQRQSTFYFIFVRWKELYFPFFNSTDNRWRWRILWSSGSIFFVYSREFGSYFENTETKYMHDLEWQ